MYLSSSDALLKYVMDALLTRMQGEGARTSSHCHQLMHVQEVFAVSALLLPPQLPVKHTGSWTLCILLFAKQRGHVASIYPKRAEALRTKLVYQLVTASARTCMPPSY
jgi:hypothetical protein